MRAYRLQFRYCKKFGLCKTLHFDGKEILVCVQFIDICSSQTCRDYRSSCSGENDKAVMRALEDKPE